jgi:MFS family permease
MKNVIIKLNKYVYYGWIIVVISGIAFFMSSPGQTYSISVFINEYNKDFDFSSTLISTAYSVATVISGLLLIFMGKAVDKFGQRKMMMIVGLLLAITAFYNSFVSSLIMISIGFFFLRYFGQGSLTLIPNSLVPQWFTKKRALAISLSTIGSLLGTLLIPSFNLWLINLIGWQMTYRVWSLILILVFLPLVYIFIGNKPEDYDITVENEKSSMNDYKSNLLRIEQESFTLKEAIKTKEFWLAGIISMVPSMFSTGLTFHFFKIMELRSVSESQAAFIVGLIAFPAFFIPFIARGVIDKYPVKYTLSITNLMIIIGMLMLMFIVKNQISAIIFILFYGLAIAIQNVTLNVLWPNYFGRKYLGSIRGAATIFMVIGSALGPLPFGLSFDLTESFNTAIIGMIIFTLFTFAFSFFIKKPHREII